MVAIQPQMKAENDNGLITCFKKLYIKEIPKGALELLCTHAQAWVQILATKTF